MNLMRLVSDAGCTILSYCLICSPAHPQLDFLLGRWEGTVRTEQGQQVQVTANFVKEGDRYGGTISGLEARHDVQVLMGAKGTAQFTRTEISLQATSEVPFKKVELDKAGVNAHFEMRGPQGTIVVRIRFVSKGETLQGRPACVLGGRVVPLSYELRRSPDHLPSPGTLRPSIKHTAHAISMLAEAVKFEKIVAEADPAARKQLIDTFAGEYPEPHLLRYLREQGTHPERQDKGMAMKDKASPKPLAAYAEDYVLLTHLADAYVRCNQINTAAPLAVRALELISSTPAPSHLSDEQWVQNTNMLMGKNFATLGFVALRRAQGIQDPAGRSIEAGKSVAPFLKALEYKPRDG